MSADLELHPELEAMLAIETALEPLDSVSRARVLEWCRAALVDRAPAVTSTPAARSRTRALPERTPGPAIAELHRRVIDEIARGGGR